MRGKQAVGIILLIALITAGCAFLASRGATALPQRHCSDTPRNAVARFLQGIIEWSAVPIRLVIAEGMSAFGIFAAGDEARGYQIAVQLHRHPEVTSSDDDVGIQSLDALELGDIGNGETRVLLKRVDVITTNPRAGLESESSRPPQEVTKVFHRNFAVRFQPDTNCISAARPLDKAWTRIR